jgi:hypothetical protein
MRAFLHFNRVVTGGLVVVALLCHVMGHDESAFYIASALIGWMWSANWRDGE